jgi:hypothetical protein
MNEWLGPHSIKRVGLCDKFASLGSLVVQHGLQCVALIRAVRRWVDLDIYDL